MHSERVAVLRINGMISGRRVANWIACNKKFTVSIKLPSSNNFLFVRRTIVLLYKEFFVRRWICLSLHFRSFFLSFFAYFLSSPILSPFFFSYFFYGYDNPTKKSDPKDSLTRKYLFSGPLTHFLSARRFHNTEMMNQCS